MASAWSRISSKVITHPPYADEASADGVGIGTAIRAMYTASDGQKKAGDRGRAARRDNPGSQMPGIDGVLLVVVIGDGTLGVPVDCALRRPAHQRTWRIMPRYVASGPVADHDHTAHGCPSAMPARPGSAVTDRRTRAMPRHVRARGRQRARVCGKPHQPGVLPPPQKVYAEEFAAAGARAPAEVIRGRCVCVQVVSQMIPLMLQGSWSGTCDAPSPQRHTQGVLFSVPCNLSPSFPLSVHR